MSCFVNQLFLQHMTCFCTKCKLTEEKLLFPYFEDLIYVYLDWIKAGCINTRSEVSFLYSCLCKSQKKLSVTVKQVEDILSVIWPDIKRFVFVLLMQMYSLSQCCSPLNIMTKTVLISWPCLNSRIVCIYFTVMNSEFVSFICLLFCHCALNIQCHITSSSLILFAFTN